MSGVDKEYRDSQVWYPEIAVLKPIKQIIEYHWETYYTQTRESDNIGERNLFEQLGNDGWEYVERFTVRQDRFYTHFRVLFKRFKCVDDEEGRTVEL